MGTNKGKLKQAKRAKNASGENRRKQVLATEREKAKEVEDIAGAKRPATPDQLAALEAQYKRHG